MRECPYACLKFRCVGVQRVNLCARQVSITPPGMRLILIGVLSNGRWGRGGCLSGAAWGTPAGDNLNLEGLDPVVGAACLLVGESVS